jgi:hypothetical protein
MSALTDAYENTLIDVLWRGQSATINGKTLSWSAAPTKYFGLLTAAPTDSSGGTEVSGGSYARVGVLCSLANFAGTQAAGSTSASSGTAGTTSNNSVITFPTPTGDWGRATHIGVWDAPTGGTMTEYGALANAKNINNGDPAPTFPAATFAFQIDN